MKSKADGIFSQDTPQKADGTGKETVVLPVRVIPRAVRNEIVGVEGDTLKVRVTAPPTRGKANQALVKLLAKGLGVRNNQVEILSGHKARRKMVRVDGIERSAILEWIRERKAKS